MRKNTIYFMIGVPGSGKSTTVKTIQALDSRIDVICPDSIRKHITGSESIFTHERTVWAIVRQRIAHATRTGRSCILDATGANLHQRREMVSYMHGLDADSFVQAVWVKVPLEVSIARNAARDRVVPNHVIENMWNKLDQFPPTTFDGFDQVDVVDNAT